MWEHQQRRAKASYSKVIGPFHQKAVEKSRFASHGKVGKDGNFSTVPILFTRFLLLIFTGNPTVLLTLMSFCHFVMIVIPG